MCCVTAGLANSSTAHAASEPVLPRLDTTNIITAFSVSNPDNLDPLASTTYTGSARSGVPFVNDPNRPAGTRWVNISSVFPGFIYDISLAPAPSLPLNVTDLLPPSLATLDQSGIPVGRLRVTVRKADGSVWFSTCSVSTTTGSPVGLSTANCTTQTQITNND